MSSNDWTQFQILIMELEHEGLVTRTFRRLDPERQQVVLEAILDEAGEHGPANMNIKRVAKKANVSVGSLYQYFADRDGMLDFATELSVRYIREAFDQYQKYLVSLPLRDALNWYVLGGIEWGSIETRFLKFFARAAYQSEPELAERFVRPIATILQNMVEGILLHAEDRGELRSDIDINKITPLIHTITIAVGDSFLIPYLDNYYLLDKITLQPEETVAALVDLIVSGIGKSRDQGISRYE